jgi:hypothetical protein
MEGMLNMEHRKKGERGSKDLNCRAGLKIVTNLFRSLTKDNFP